MKLSNFLDLNLMTITSVREAKYQRHLKAVHVNAIAIRKKEFLDLDYTNFLERIKVCPLGFTKYDFCFTNLNIMTRF